MAAENTLHYYIASSAAQNPHASFSPAFLGASIRSRVPAGYTSSVFAEDKPAAPPTVIPTGTGVISGTVLEAGSPVARIVRAYRRSDGLFLAQTTSNGGTGAFSFTTLPNSTECFVVAFDDTGVAPDFNALIFDRITT